MIHCDMGLGKDTQEAFNCFCNLLFLKLPIMCMNICTLSQLFVLTEIFCIKNHRVHTIKGYI